MNATVDQHEVWARWGLVIYHARERAEWTQQDLADLIGVTQGTVANWEAGRRPCPYHQRVELCRLLTIKPATLAADHQTCPRCGSAGR